MRLVLAVLLLLALQACDTFDTEKMFSFHASQVEKGDLKNLRGGKVACMHCPMYFAFDAEPALVNRIIARHRLQPVPSPPPEAQEIEALVHSEASWWQPAAPKDQDKVYWVRYKPKVPAEERAFRYLVLKNKQAFFITSGYFSPDHYEPDNP